MPKIRVKNFGPIKNGFSSKNGFMDIERVTVFIGDQGTGKSSVAKLISTLSWIEKALVRRDVKESEVTRKGNFENKFCAYQNIKNYFDKAGKTEIDYEGKAYSFSYRDKVFKVSEKPTNGFLIPKIMYVPAERNFVSAVDTPSSLKKLPSTLYTFLDEFENAKQNLREGLKLPISNVTFEYDRLNKLSHIKGNGFRVRLSEASSGFQSFVPLFLVTRYLAQSINQENDNSRSELSVDEERRIRREIKKILSNKNLSEEIKNAALEILSTRFKNACFLNIVEEIEQNLFPTSQRKVLNSLLNYANLTRGNTLILTTHSPYIINYLTIAIKGNSVLEEIEKSISSKDLKSKLNEIVPIDSCIASKDVVIYELSNQGEIKKLKDYQGIPSDNNYLNQILAETNQLFDALLEIEESL
jgi:predicted ATPase